jgi:hypothetical protein
MLSDFNRYAVSRSDSISRQSSIGTITAVGSPCWFDTIWISGRAIPLSIASREGKRENASFLQARLPVDQHSQQ